MSREKVVSVDYYKVLQISRAATQEDIHASYKVQIKRWHPDVAGNNAINVMWTQMINEAYDTLSDPLKRAIYDMREVKKNNAAQHTAPNSTKKAKPHRKGSALLNFLVYPVILVVIFVAINSSRSFRSPSQTEAPSPSSTVPLAPQAPLRTGPPFAPKPIPKVITLPTPTPDPVSRLLLPADLPANGETHNYFSHEPIAPFEIKVPAGDDYYYVLLKGKNIGRKALSIFVYPGESVTVNAHTGEYLLYYASGTTWYGVDNLFGEHTVYSKSLDVLNFYEADGYVNGYTVTLYKTYNGNMETTRASPEDFA
jgi:hypothetical protein